MDGFQIQFLTHFLLITCVAILGGLDIPLYFQNMYPDCKTSQNKPDMSNPECSRPSILQQIAMQQPGFREYTINTSDLYKCFAEPKTNITISAALHGSVMFNGTIPFTGVSNCQNKTCLCEMFVIGPEETFFEIQPQNVNSKMATTNHSIDIYYGSEKRTLLEETLQTRSNVLSMIISVTEGNKVAFAFRFQAVPDCERQLQVRCLSTTNGYIETLGWAEGKSFSVPVNSCLTLHAPDDHVTMISLISINLEPNGNSIGCNNYLYLHVTSNCGARPRNRICKVGDLPPTLFNNIRAVSFKLTSQIQAKGFRLLYSFHSRPQQPLQLPNGQWNCSVDYYMTFQQHFACHPDSYCADQSVQVPWFQTETCGANVARFDERYYQIFKPQNWTNWKDASVFCIKKGGLLAVLKKESTTKKLKELAAVTHPSTRVFVGLRPASDVISKEMYQYTWIWADGTLAVYLHLTLEQGTPGDCTALNHNSLKMFPCEQNSEAAFICETGEKELLVARTTANVSIATNAFASKDNITRCNNEGHFTHTFLECDVSADCNADDLEESIACSIAKGPPVPFFMCRSQEERVPYTLVCDFRRDCCDGSDEDFCKFPACDGEDRFLCADGKQCISKTLWCDKRSDCVDGSDETKCGIISDDFISTIVPPAVVEFTGRGSFTVKSIDTSSCPETHYQCPGGGYCMPVYTRCNGVNDCPGKEDEKDCDHYTCPGFYRCRNSKICLHQSHLCDDIFQCPKHDDELLCSLKCPSSCTCYGYAFICIDLPAVYFDSEVRYLDVKSGKVHPSNLTENTKLIHLSLRHCSITELGHLDFPNLHHLDLSNNGISVLDYKIFANLNNLVSVSLAHNPLLPRDSFFQAYHEAPNILRLNISGVEITNWYDGFLGGFSNLQVLNMSNCKLTTMTEAGFQGMNNLHTLDISGCPMEKFFPHVFEGLHKLNHINAQNYELCCPEVMPKRMKAENCKAPSDEISSCDALLRKDVFRVFLALYACLSLIGNLGSFIYRVFIEKSAAKIGYEVFVTHLSVADFLMGVYLAIIGVADRIYSGNYRWKDVEWRESAACKLAGSLSLVSSEVSACLICLITLERFLVIRFPHKHLRFSQRIAHTASMAVWLIGLVLALIPLLPITAYWRFYSQSGICIPLPITRNQFPGMNYSFAVMIVMNLVLFLFIAVGQILIYWSFRSNTVTCFDAKRKAKEKRVARRLLAVVMTDFLCWFPIGLLGVLARSGVPIPGEVNVAMAIFVLPFNSALNPFLYTLNAVMERRQNASRDQKYQNKNDTLPSPSTTEEVSPQPESKKEELSYTKEEALQLFRGFLQDSLLTNEQVRRRVWNIYEG